MKKSKYYLFFPAVFAVLVIFSASLISCPPLDESSPTNIIVVPAGELTTSKWTELLDDIYSKGIFAGLDLSACTPAATSDNAVLKRTNQNGSDYVSNGNIYDDYIQFNPSAGSRFGKDLITSIILPDKATMISNASSNIDLDILDDVDKDDEDNEINRYAFRQYKNLKSISGKNIYLVGSFAFFNCTVLQEANFPELRIAMSYAFYNCMSLKKLQFEKLTHIMPSAFEGCRSIERVEAYEADVVPQRAFKNCTNLTEVWFYKIKMVEAEAFRNCSKLKSARFPTTLARTTSAHPLDPWRSGNSSPYTPDSMSFHNNAFRGCVSLEFLDIRNAWNVYFGAGALSDIGKSLELFLFDDDGTKSYGHPQVELLLGKRPVPESDLTAEEKDMDIGKLTLKELKIIAPSVSPPDKSQIMYKDNKEIPSEVDGYASIRNRINATYNPSGPGDRYRDYNEPKNPIVKVTVNGKPTKADITN